MTCGIYKITRKDTGQCYIGLSEDIEKRYRQHANGKDMKYSRIDREMVKHGEDKFDLEIIEELPNNRTLLMKREEYWVAYYNTYKDKNHYNLTPGGDFCPSKLPEVRAKISKAMSGRKLSQKTKDKLSKINSGENHPIYGKKRTQETKEKISKTLSKAHNTSGYYRVRKEKNSECKQGFVWRYEYREDGRKKRISSVDIKKLEKKVKAKDLEWIKFDE